MPLTMPEPRVLLAAIARDEGAYISEWVAHHLMLDVAGIEIYVNQTEDNTCDILRQIGQVHSQVRFRHADHIRHEQYSHLDHMIRPMFLRNNPLQARAYAELWQRGREEGYSHVLFIDIDEYLVLAQHDSINAFIRSTDDQDLYCFQWFNAGGDPKAFMPALKPINQGVKTFGKSTTKCMVATRLDRVEIHNPHLMNPPRGSRIWNTTAWQASHGPGVFSDHSFQWQEDAWVHHCINRDRLEYLSILGRSNPCIWNTRNNLKLTRDGWTAGGPDSTHLDKTRVLTGRQCYRTLVDNAALAPLIQAARAFVQQRLESVRETIEQTQKLNDQMQHILAGTQMDLTPTTTEKNLATLRTVLHNLLQKTSADHPEQHRQLSTVLEALN
jgi:hypothetical protein